MVLGGLACNKVLPVRIGELLRARWLSTDAPMPGGRALGTIALDRACDVVTLALFVAVGLNVVASPGWLVRMAVGAAFLVVLVAAALVFARQYARRRPRDRRARGGCAGSPGTRSRCSRRRSAVAMPRPGWR